MIDLSTLLNTDALTTIRDALESHVYWQLSDTKYRKNGFVLAPGCRDPTNLAEIIASCELAREIGKAIGAPSWLDDLLEQLDEQLHNEDVVYRCKCSWVGGDPDIGAGRRTKGSYGRLVDSNIPTCPACWKHDRKRAIVVVSQDPGGES